MRMTIELDGITAGTLELARVARAISRTKERITQAEAEIAATQLRLRNHLKRFRAEQRARRRRLVGQQTELRSQMRRLKKLNPKTS
jgi:uncharacterized protein involved in exopolysaccharide biosynthesis